MKKNLEEIIQIKNQELSTKKTETKANLQRIDLLNKTIEEQKEKNEKYENELKEQKYIKKRMMKN